MFLTKENLLKLARAYSQLPILAEVTQKKAEIGALQTVISEEQRARLNQKIRLDWNYHSNCIEGNTLDYGQTTAFLMHGYTAKGKPFKDYVDIKGHNEIMQAIIELAKNPDLQLTQRDLREYHSVLLVESYEVKTESITGVSTTKRIKIGEYKSLPNHVRTQTGEIHHYALPEEVPALMSELLDFYHEAKQDKTIHPLVIAALFHYQFVAIHPFDDGNGRMSRLLMNLILMQHHYQPVIIRSEKDAKNDYYDALSDADNDNHETFINLIAEYELAACDLFIKAAHNESIEDPDDIDKEIALLEQSLKTQENYIEKIFSIDNAKDVYNTSIIKALECLKVFQAKISSLFAELKFGTFKKWNDEIPNILSFEYACFGNRGNFFNTLEFLFHFGKYKHLTNCFSFNLKVCLIFEETYFIFSMGIENLKPFYSSQHKYADTFTNIIIDKIYQAAGKAIINTIKALLENPNYIKKRYDLENRKESDLPF